MIQLCSEVRRYVRQKMKDNPDFWRQMVGKPIKRGRTRYQEAFYHGESYVLTLTRPKLIKK